MFSLNPATALIVVDCQNDFVDPAGSLYVKGGEAVVERINGAIAEAAEARAFVVYTRDWHPESTPHFQKDGGIWPVHCVAGTWGAEFFPLLQVVGPEVRKGANGEDGYSGFTMRDPVTGEVTPTALHGMLQEVAASRVVVAGLALDYCVNATGLDALELGYETSCPLELTAAVNLSPEDGATAAERLRAAGAHVS
ncbi:MAG: isochorismatase family protein [Actinomycetota bacterium]